MDIDLELYCRGVHLSSNPLVRFLVIDISPERPRSTILFLYDFGGRAIQWIYQLQKFSLENRVIVPDLRGHGQSDRPSRKCRYHGTGAQCSTGTSKCIGR